MEIESLFVKDDIQGGGAMRNWLQWRRRKNVTNNRVPRPSISDIQVEYSGLFVALKNGEVVEAAQTPYELIAALHRRQISDSTIIRVPDPQEPELVGWG